MDQIELIQTTLRVLEELDLTYMVVGSIASSYYGEPRFTQDVDVVVDLPRGLIRKLCDAFPSPDFYVSADAALQAVRTEGQFNIIDSISANKVDVMIAKAGGWHQAQLTRRRRVLILPDTQAFAASPEDVILSKMDYYREGGSEKHLRDITGILKVTGAEVDRDYVARWARDLGLAEIWEAVQRRANPEQ